MTSGDILCKGSVWETGIRVLVAGFGNELLPGDMCGKKVVEALPGCLEARWLGRGVQALIHLLPKYDIVFLVDASRRVEPGSVRVAEFDPRVCGERIPSSLHEAGLVEAVCMALEVAESLGRSPRVYMVECGVRDVFDEKSVEPAIREAVEAILARVGSCGGSGAKG